MVIDERLRLGARDRIHVHGFQTPRQTNVSGLVGFHHYIAGPTLDREF
jgi:hypothetical protein